MVHYILDYSWLHIAKFVLAEQVTNKLKQLVLTRHNENASVCGGNSTEASEGKNGTHQVAAISFQQPL